MKWSIILSLLLAQSAWSSMESAYQEGDSYTSSLHEKAKTGLPNTNINEVPGFQTTAPGESTLYQGGNLGDTAQKSLSENEAGKVVIETAKTRQRFEINPETDPLFKSREISAEKHLNIDNSLEITQKEGIVEKTCEEGGEDMTLECHENLEIKVDTKDETIKANILIINLVETILYGKNMGAAYYGCHTPSRTDLAWEFHKIYTKTHEINLDYFKTKICPALVLLGQVNIDCNSVKSYTMSASGENKDRLSYHFNIDAKKQNISSELWHSNCHAEEALVEEGFCQYLDRSCSQGPATRVINGLPVTRDCWQYKQRYQCKMIKDECSALRSQGCYQVSSKCKEMKQGRCWVYEQFYDCPNGKLATAKIKSPALEAFCLTGDCHNNSYQSNGEMLEVISRLSLLKEIQDDIRAQGQGSFHIFKGNHYQCSRNCISFKDCCGGLKGWGVSMKLAGCQEEEKLLAQMREQNLCQEIGTYCAQKVLGKCVSKRTSFCCFGSKFGRLLQQQGRAQLGLGWSEAKCPDCRGFTVEELSKMDLSKMDFRELFVDVIKRYKQPDYQALQQKTGQKIQQNIRNIKQGLKAQHPKSGVLEDHKDGL